MTACRTRCDPRPARVLTCCDLNSIFPKDILPACSFLKEQTATAHFFLHENHRYKTADNTSTYDKIAHRIYALDHSSCGQNYRSMQASFSHTRRHQSYAGLLLKILLRSPRPFVS